MGQIIRCFVTASVATWLAVLVLSQLIGCGTVEIGGPAWPSADALFLDGEGNVCEPNLDMAVPRQQEGLQEFLSACLKLERGDIGVDGLAFEYHGIYIAFSDWIQKGDSPGDYVGFRFAADQFVQYAVKAGGEIYVGAGDTWLHPAGTAGPEASGISFVAICDDPIPGCDDEGCCEVGEDPADDSSGEDDPTGEDETSLPPPEDPV